jgi:secondary thiamine-phosphate synthase enzyme
MALLIRTERSKEIVDITDLVNKKVQQNKSARLCLLFVKHTTACITTADLDPGTDLDMLDAFEKIIPKLKYRHPHNPNHVPDHILSSIIGQSVIIPINNGQLELGTWQRVVLIELDGPKDREIVMSLI